MNEDAARALLNSLREMDFEQALELLRDTFEEESQNAYDAGRQDCDSE
jgi:hypothetical protein